MTPSAQADPFTRWHQRQSCGRKRQYVTHAEAQTALERWVGWRDPRCRVYHCSCCGLYHHGRYAVVPQPA